MTIILGGDSLSHKRNKDPETNRGSSRGCDRMATPLGTLGLSLVIVFFIIMLCVVVFFTMNDTLFKSFSMHLYILSYMV